MGIYQTKSLPFTGTKFKEVRGKAMNMYKSIASKTKRRPYVLSAYFGKQKIFLDYFWAHLFSKNIHDQIRRLRFFPCAIELMQYSKMEPEITGDKTKSSEILYRFFGSAKLLGKFSVQIKKDVRKNNLYFISVFPSR